MSGEKARTAIRRTDGCCRWLGSLGPEGMHLAARRDVPATHGPVVRVARDHRAVGRDSHGVDAELLTEKLFHVVSFFWFVRTTVPSLQPRASLSDLGKKAMQPAGMWPVSRTLPVARSVSLTSSTSRSLTLPGVLMLASVVPSGEKARSTWAAIFEPETRLGVVGQPLFPFQPKLAGVGRLARLDLELASLRPCRQLPPEGPKLIVQPRGQARDPVAAVAQVLHRFSLLPGEPRIRPGLKPSMRISASGTGRPS